jgi:hypothetical protein
MNHPQPFRNSNGLMANEMCSILDRNTSSKSACSGHMINLHSVVAFVHKAKWAELAITHEISRVLRENTISYSTVGKYVRTFVLSSKETDTPVVPELEGDFVLPTASPLCSQRSHFLSPPNCSEGDDVKINSVSPFDADYEMEIAAS